MPLKLVRRGRIWHVRGTVAGQNIQETTGTDRRDFAESYRIKRENQVLERRIHGERSTVTFAEAALSYLEFEARSQNTVDLVHRLLNHFALGWDTGRPGDWTLADEIDQRAVDEACAAILRPGSAAATRQRNVITPLTSILRHAKKRKWCDLPDFERPKIPKTKPRFLTPNEACALLDAGSKASRRNFLFYLCTGARASEGLDLEWEGGLDLTFGLCPLWDTKNGDRIVKMPPALIVDLANSPTKTGRVLRRRDGKPYKDQHRLHGGQLDSALKFACEKAKMEKLTLHDLRHTWATWFYAATLDPLRLKAEGGWSSLAMVEKYAHRMSQDLVPGISKIWGVAHPDQFGVPIDEKMENLL